MEIIPGDVQHNLQTKKQHAAPPVSPEVFASLLDQHVHKKIQEIAKHETDLAEEDVQNKPVDAPIPKKDEEEVLRDQLDKAKKRLIRFVDRLRPQP